MGSLSNLYISQSYVSLIHLGSDSFITTQSVELQDGLGNGLGIFVNSLGDVNISGDISASNIPAEITSLPQFNQYTASTNTRLNNIESTTASLNQSVTQLNASSASQQVSINNLNLYTASFSTASIQTSITELNQFSASAKVSINALNVFTASQSTASIVTSITNLNTFTSSANVRLNNLESTSASVNISISNLNGATSSYVTETESGSFLITASFDNGSRNLTFTKGNNSTFAVNIPDVSGSIIATGSLMVTGSVNVNVLTFTKGDGSTFSLTVSASGSAPDGTVSSSAQIVALGFLQTSSFNAYTSSTNVRLNNLESTTASLNTSISNLNTATQSLFVSASLALVTASINNDDITFTKGDGSQFTIQVATGSFALSASFAETASIARNLVITARNGNPSTLPIGTVVHITSAVGDNPIFNTASYDTELLSANTLGILRQAATTGTDVEVVVQGTVTGVDTDPVLGYAAGDVIYLSSSGQFTKVQPQAPNQIVVLGQVLRAQQNNGSIYVSINNGWELNELHNVQINNPQTGDLIQYESSSYGLWKNKSIEGAGITTTSSFNSFTSSINSYTSSTNTRLNSIEAVTGSYATTGSNSFNGNQVITGSVIISGSATTDLTVIGQIYVSSSATGGTTAPQIIVSGSQGTTTIRRNQITTRNLTYQNTFSPILVDNSNLTTADAIGMTIDATAGGVAGWGLGGAIYVNNVVGDTYPAVFGFQNKANYTDGRVAVLTPLSASAGFTASLQNGYAWVGNSLGENSQVATSSFGGGGGAGFPFTGSAAITGSLAVTGSVRGFTNTLSVVSSTASINMNDGNFFRLTLPTGSTTHVAISNLSSGQTINLLVSQSLAATGSIAFAPNIRFAGGVDYTATAITGAMDIVSFVSFDTNQIFATQVKNLS